MSTDSNSNNQNSQNNPTNLHFRDYTGKYPTFDLWSKEVKRRIDGKRGFIEKLKEVKNKDEVNNAS